MQYYYYYNMQPIIHVVYESNQMFHYIPLYYAKACNEFEEPISTSSPSDNIVLFQEMLQRWRAVGNTVSDLTDQKFGPQTFRPIDEHSTYNS